MKVVHERLGNVQNANHSVPCPARLRRRQHTWLGGVTGGVGWPVGCLTPCARSRRPSCHKSYMFVKPIARPVRLGPAGAGRGRVVCQYKVARVAIDVLHTKFVKTPIRRVVKDFRRPPSVKVVLASLQATPWAFPAHFLQARSQACGPWPPRALVAEGPPWTAGQGCVASIDGSCPAAGALGELCSPRAGAQWPWAGSVGSKEVARAGAVQLRCLQAPAQAPPTPVLPRPSHSARSLPASCTPRW